MILDVHAYIGKWPHWPVPFSTPQEVVSALKRWSIDRAVVSSTRGLFVSWEDGNRETARAVETHPGELIAFACLGPSGLSHSSGRRGFDFEGYWKAGFRGVRLYPQYHTYHLLYEPFVDQICEEATARQWPVQLPLRVIMNWGMPAIDLSWIVALVGRHPQVPWILTGINYFHELGVALALVRRFPSVYLETSCMQGFQAIAKVVEQSGSGQLLFGSGSPLQNGAAGVQKILHARIHDSDREAILSGNACRLLQVSH